MRPKFRAWDKARNEMNYRVMVGNCDTDDENWTCPIIWIEEKKDWLHFDDYECIMQSTGLKDKNGKEIFEGDIVKRDGIKRPEVVRFGEWIDVDSLGYKEQYIGFYFESEHEGQEWLHSVEPQFNNLYKIIGNIYENPELLEDDK